MYHIRYVAHNRLSSGQAIRRLESTMDRTRSMFLSSTEIEGRPGLTSSLQSSRFSTNV